MTILMSTITMQGGEPPRIFSPTICQYISGGLMEKCNPTIEEVPNLAVRSSLLKVIGHDCHAILNWMISHKELPLL